MGKYDASNEWKKENAIKFTLLFTNNSGVPEALRKMEALTGEKPSKYLRRVIMESLTFDGFLPENPTHPADKK